MKHFPTDPMRQNDMLIAAFCEDLFDMVVERRPASGTPKTNRIAEIIRQTNSKGERTA